MSVILGILGGQQQQPPPPDNSNTNANGDTSTQSTQPAGDASASGGSGTSSDQSGTGSNSAGTGADTQAARNKQAEVSLSNASPKSVVAAQVADPDGDRGLSAARQIAAAAQQQARTDAMLEMMSPQAEKAPETPPVKRVTDEMPNPLPTAPILLRD